MIKKDKRQRGDFKIKKLDSDMRKPRRKNVTIRINPNMTAEGIEEELEEFEDDYIYGEE